MKKVNGKIISTSLAVAMMLTMPGPAAMASEFQADDTISAFSDSAAVEDTQSANVQDETPVVEDESVPVAQASTIWASDCSIYLDGKSYKKSYSRAYNATAVDIKVKYHGDWLSHDKYNYSLIIKKSGKEVGEIKYDGTYTITISDDYGNSKSVTCTINKDNSRNTISNVSISNYTYGGQPATLTAEAKYDNNGDKNGNAVGWQIFTKDGNRYTTCQEQSFNKLSAGDYYVRASVKETSSYMGAYSGYYLFTVNKAETTITINDGEDKIYDGKPLTAPSDITVNGRKTALSGNWFKLNSETNMYEPLSTGDVPVNAGNYRYTVTFAGDTNYNEKSESKNFTITPAENTISFVNDSDITQSYNGEAVTNPEAKDGIGDVSYVWKTEDGTELSSAPTDAGKYTFSVTAAGNENYYPKTITKNVEITQAPNEWTKNLSMSRVIYEGAVDDPIAEAKYGDVEFWYSRYKDFSEAGTAKPTASGKWYVRAQVEETSNYKGLVSDPEVFHIASDDVAVKYYTLNAKADENGKISPTGVVNAEENSSWVYKITPNEGYEIADVLVDGKSVGAVSTYTFSDVSSDHTIEATFKKSDAKDPQNDVTVNTDGSITVANTDIKVSSGTDGSQPQYNKDEKVILTADGSVISRPGLEDLTAGKDWKVTLDGTVTDTDGNVYKTDGSVYGTNGSIKNADGTYAQPAKAMIISTDVVKNAVKVTLSDECEGAQGYDYVLGTSEDMIQTKQYTKVSKNKTSKKTTFKLVDKGTWYVACHAWVKDAEGKKVFGPWSEVKEVSVTAVTPATPKIKKVSVKGSSVTVTYTAAKNATGYDIALGSELDSSKLPAGEDKVVKKVGNTVTVTFKKVKAGNYYVAVRGWNRTADDNAKVFGKWSAVKPVKVK